MKRNALRLFLMLCLAPLSVVAQNKDFSPLYPIGGMCDNMVAAERIHYMDSLLNDYYTKLRYPTKKDTAELNVYNFKPHEVPRYSPREYEERLKKIPSEIPLDYNEKVQTFIDLYAVRKRQLTSRILGRQSIYFPIIEEIFYREDLPMELKYVAVIESALHPKAVSPASAVGLWQFMHATGRMYDLNLNTYIDERMDPYKATVAAAGYLRDLHKIYNNWHLAIAAYNCGPGRVNYAIRRSGGNTDFWELMKYLPRETASYVPAFIAATYVLNYPAEHNLYPIYDDFSFQVDSMKIENRKLSLDQIAAASNSDPELLQRLNPELRRGVVPNLPKPYVLRVPEQTAYYFRLYGTDMLKTPEEMERERLATMKQIKHLVVRGESPEGIAAAYSVKESDLREWNNISRRWVYPDEELVIYVPKEYEVNPLIVEAQKQARRDFDARGGQAPEIASKVHRVQKGDTLWKIAERYDTSLDELLSINGLRRNAVLHPGQKIKVGG